MKSDYLTGKNTLFQAMRTTFVESAQIESKAPLQVQ